MAKQYVTVVLTGDGGDEAFCGYDRYRAMMVTRFLARLKIVHKMGKWLSSPGGELRSFRTRLWRFSQTLAHPPADQYSMLMRVFSETQLQDLCGPELRPVLDRQPDFVARAVDSFTEQASWAAKANLADFQTYLPGDLLVKLDRASMANSLEARSPFLDHALLEFARSLPLDYKMGLRKGKKILRDTFGSLLPPELLQAPKRGFGVPMGQWLRGNLAGQMQGILTQKACLVRQNLLRPEFLAELINSHLSGNADHGPRLWSLMVLEKFLSTGAAGI